MLAEEIDRGFERMLVPLREAMGSDNALSAEEKKKLREHFLNGGSIADWALDNLDINDGEYAQAMGRHLGLPFRDGTELDDLDYDALRNVCSAQTAIRFGVIPLRIEASESGDAPVLVELAHYDPVSTVDRVMVRREIDCPIQWILFPRLKIRSGLQKMYGVGADTFDDLLAKKTWGEDDFDFKEEVAVVDDDDSDASVVKFVHQILNEALKQRATDIHIEPLRNDLRIRYRIDGVLRKVDVPENFKQLQSAVIARLKTMSELDISEKRKPQDGSARLKWEDKEIDVRVATIPSVEGESISLRLLGQDQFDIDSLEMFSELRGKIDSLLENPNGIVLVTGPTGCGKSTSLFCFLSVLNSEDTKIVTIEDPVENKLEGVVQIAVKPEIDLTFASGLRSILRGDPNVVMIGEIRDLETAEISVQAALTGHLVFSTLHTNDSAGGVIRLMDLGVEPFLISSAVRAFIAQRLVRKLCLKCRMPATYPMEFLRSVEFPEIDLSRVYQVNPKGCDSCNQTGFKGRTAVFELFELTPKIQELIVSRATKQELMDQAVKDGFIKMREYGWRKVIEGKTTIEEVVSATANT